MKINEVLTGLSVAAGFAGIAAWILAVVTERTQIRVLGMGSLHLFIESALFFLAAIWFKLGAIYHKK